MENLDYSILKRAYNNARELERATQFLDTKGIDRSAFKRDPDRYRDIIKQYSIQCINQSIFQESREILDMEFNRLCEYQRFNSQHLVDDFYDKAKDIILASIEE